MQTKRVTLALGFISCFLVAALARADEDEGSGLDALVELLAVVEQPEVQLDLLKGMHEGLRGRKNLQMPRGWSALYVNLAKSPNAEVREVSQLLALAFGDPQALAALRKTMMDKKAPAGERADALAALVEHRAKGLAPLLQKLVEEGSLLSPAIRGLGAYADPATPQVILEQYASLTAAEKQDAVTTLASRPAYALALLDAVEKKRIPRTDISAFTARQLHDLGDQAVSEKLVEVWGAIRQTSGDKKALIAKYKRTLTPKLLKKANLSAGRVVFSRTCMQCHTLYGVGGKIGPDLTGSNRANLDYVLENALDPSAVIGKDYRLTNFVTDDGRLISGIIHERTDETITIQTVNQRVILAIEEIDEMRDSPVSMMPEGQLEKLKPEEVRDLVAYLATKNQVPLPPGVTLESLSSTVTSP